jgi:3-oxoacyl-[acyl-carrier protein] reductase
MGAAIARRLAASGASVAVTDVVPSGTRNFGEDGEKERVAGWQGLPSLVNELERSGSKACAVVGDIANSDDVDRMVADVVSQFGKIDILVNNAAKPKAEGEFKNSWEVPEEAWDEVIRVNLKGCFLMSSAIARHLLERKAPMGRIVNISSIDGRWGAARAAPYSASKFAVIGLTQSMALDLAPYGVTVNAVCPGAIDTSRSLSNPRPQRPDPTLASRMAPVGRVGQADDIARAVMFFVDPEADFITGETIMVTGGKWMY